MNRKTEPARLFERALAFHQKGELTEAVKFYTSVLSVAPGNFDARHLLGVARHQQGRHAEALELIAAALKTAPNESHALANYGSVLQALLRFDEAVAAFDRSLALAPKNPATLSRRGNALWDMGCRAEAVASYDAALKLDPRHVDALNNRAIAMRALRRPAEALANYDAALAVRPDDAEILNNRGNVLKDMNSSAEALDCFERAIGLRPAYAEAWNNRGVLLHELRRLPEALECFDRALAIHPGHAEVLVNRGLNLREQRRLAESLANLDAAVAADPAHADAWYHRGHTLQLMDRLTEASASFQKAVALKPEHEHALGGLAGAALHLCDWTGMAGLADALRAGRAIVPPLTMLGYFDDSALQLECANRYMRDRIAAPPAVLGSAGPHDHDTIRVAYLSSDFREHALASLAAGLFEHHDRSRFDVLGISLGPDDRSEMRSRLIKLFDQFEDVRLTGNREVAETLRRLEVDILVDLNGHTYGFRPEILAHRAAPVQVNYLGYPGTMGADFVDYIIADPIVLPRDRAPFYTEKIVHLPDCYQPNDIKRQDGSEVPSRADCGLPQNGFVFCCFNNSWKIAAPLFDIWMRLMLAVPGSVLWLLAGSEAVQFNLRREAASRGVDPERLVFAGRTAPADHLARHRLADLFLDTLPYNAHTTASDALWMGLPLVTCPGENFASRVATSLLHTAGLPELVTRTLEDYEALALRLARDPRLLHSFRERLEDRTGNMLFDSRRFCRQIEAAYSRMMEIFRAGEAPQAFTVAPQASSCAISLSSRR